MIDAVSGEVFFVPEVTDRLVELVQQIAPVPGEAVAVDYHAPAAA